MSNDLISRKELLNWIEKEEAKMIAMNKMSAFLCDSFVPCIETEQLKKHILMQPAFDAEKVKLELIELRNAEVHKPYSPHSYAEAQKQGRYSAFSEAISIVEKGGIK